MCRAERMIAWLMAFADRNPEYQVWISSRTGHGPTLARALETAVHLEDLRSSWRDSGSPKTDVIVAEGLRERLESKLRGLKMLIEPIQLRQTHRVRPVSDHVR